MRGVLQPVAHLLGDRHEQVVEDLEQHRVGMGARRMRMRPRLRAFQHQIEASAHACPPAGFDDRGGVGLGDHRRPVDHRAGRQRFAQVQGGIVPAVLSEETNVAARCRDIAERGRRAVGARPIRHRRCRHIVTTAGRALRRIAAAPCLHHRSIDDQRPPFEQEREPLPVARFELCAQLRCQVAIGGPIDRQRRVRTVIAKLQAPPNRDALCGRPLLDQVGTCSLLERVQRRACLLQAGRVQAVLDRAFPHRRLFRQPHAVGRQHAGQRMDSTRGMASASATRQACCPPAPPNVVSVYSVTS
jgi:hypothetical protein